MRIAIVGPGIMPIPPTGWGAVEILIWDYKLALEKLGHEVCIVNTPSPVEILQQINGFRPDFVHVQYDDFVELCPHIPYPNAVTSHFGYLEQPFKWDYYGPRVAKKFAEIEPIIFCLSPGIKETYQKTLNISSDKLFVTPNGVNVDKFSFKEIPKYPERSIYLAKIDYRKRQHMFQGIDSLWFAGNLADNRFNPQKNYLGEWSKDTLYKNLTDYGNLVLLSDGEAHPLVCLEAFASGLGVVISQWAAANLDLSKDFITVIPEDKINDIEYVEQKIVENREYSVNNREEILEYAKQFDWVNVVKNQYIPIMQKIIDNNKPKNIVSIFAGHDANVSFYNAEKDEYHLIEIERLVKKRYFRLHVDNSTEEIRDILMQCQKIATEEWGIKNDYEIALVCSDGWVNPPSLIKEVFNADNVRTIAKHHHCHASATFHQSPFDEALIVSYDGGGDDGFFNIYSANSNGVNLLESIPSDFGGGYLLCGSLVREVAEKSRHQLALSGKLMGLCAYGNVIEKYVPAFSEFFFDRNYKKLAESTGLPLKNLDDPWKNPMDNWIFEEQEAYDIAATAQEAFERAFFSVLDKYDQNVPLCLCGGAALNVLVNEKVKNTSNRQLYISPNPHDGSLSLGHMFLYKTPSKKVEIAYSGLPLLDRKELPSLIKEHGATKVTKKDIANLLKEGNIIGLVYGDSEVGPRALGNRSIVCDPNIKQMKDILNAKVKFREWYRPFAPFCKKEDAAKYFESSNFDNLEYMSYAPKVRDEYVDVLPSITHVDNTARLQTVTETSHSHFYELLTEFGKISDTNVLLNTSFNIRGFPILSTIEDALYALNNTQMDYVVIEDYLFKKAS